VTVSEPTESIRPFPEAEYLAREATVRAVMAARNVDVLYVTSPANLVYLTGYEAVWYPWRLPLGCAVVREPDALIFFDWTRHEAYARLHARHDELVLFDYGDAVDVVTRALGSRGLTTGTVAVEWCSQTPAAPVTSAMAGALEALGAEIVSGDWLVDGVRLLKSKVELQRVRRAAAVADEAFAALAHELHPGLTEIQVSAMVGPC
jgi:Xaa-Pro aminopeptidase